MNTNRFALTPDELEDEAKHFYAGGTVRLRAIADELSEIAQKGEGISQSELLRLLDHLVMVYAQIGYHADCEMKNDLRAIAEELREIAEKGEAINQLELKRLHDQLVMVYALIGYHTVFEMDIEDGVPIAVYQDTYSDGTPVSIVVGPPSSRGWSWFLPDDVSAGSPPLTESGRVWRDPSRIKLLHERPRQAPTCGPPTPSSRVARMTKRPSSTGVGKSASRDGGRT